MQHWGFGLPGESVGQCLLNNACNSNSQQTNKSNQTKSTRCTKKSTTKHVKSSRKIPARQYYSKYEAKPSSILASSNNPSKQRKMLHYTNHIKRKDLTVYGEDLMHKHEDMCRIVSHNINCVGLEIVGNYKFTRAKEWLYNAQVDICGWQEVGLAQHLFQRHERLAERMRDSRRSHLRISSANNHHESMEKFQYGGTAIFAFDDLAHMIRASGADDRGLGRWSWLQFEGHRNKRVRCISAYNPCRSPLNHYSTVYSQHKRYFQEQKMDVCPRIQFRKDLCLFISKCIADGESIILMIDCNENLSKNLDLQSHLTTAPLHLIDPIRHKYQNLHQLPATSDRGSFPIDSIFVTQDLCHISRGGWLPVGFTFSDHRILYVDIPIKKILRKYKNSICPYRMRRLKCHDPKTVQEYNKILEAQYLHHNTLAKLEEFKLTRSDPITDEDFDKLCKIDKVCTDAVRHAEKKCRKLYAGQKAYTPELNRLGKTIGTWHLIIKKRYGRNISSRLIKREAQQCGIPNTNFLDLDTCLDLRRSAFRVYKSYAYDSEQKRKDFLERLADDQAAAGNITKANAINQLNLNEESRRIHSNVKAATKDFLGAPYHMELQNEDGSFLSTDRDQIEIALIQEYEAKYRLSESSPFLHEPLSSMLGHMAITPSSQQILDGTFVCPPSINKHTKKFITHLKMDDKVRKRGKNRIPITLQDSLAFWKKIPEKVSSSPSQRHIGTYKATHMNSINASIQADMLSLPYEIGRPLPRTTNCVNVSLMKKGKGITPSDMRTIWLMEVDLNVASKIHFVKRMMNECAASTNQIPESQYSKKRGKAIEAALVKVLFFDILRQTRTPGITFASDLM